VGEREGTRRTSTVSTGMRPMNEPTMYSRKRMFVMDSSMFNMGDMRKHKRSTHTMVMGRCSIRTGIRRKHPTPLILPSFSGLPPHA
jgi:hypothetical protein